jgi:hypothetical protein
MRVPGSAGRRPISHGCRRQRAISRSSRGKGRHVSLTYLVRGFESALTSPLRRVLRRASAVAYGREGLFAAGDSRSPLACARGRAARVQLCSAKLSNPCFSYFLGFESRQRAPRARNGARRRIHTARYWRRERDSNPRRAFGPYALSRGAPSTTRPSLRGAQS